MIIEDRFVWLHFGKAAGTSVRAILSTLFPNSIVIPDNTPKKHIGVREMGRFGISVPSSIPFAACFRRLPLWAESHVLQQYGDNASWENVLDAVNGRLRLSANSPARNIGLFSGVETYDDLLEYYFHSASVFPIRIDKAFNDFDEFFSLHNIDYDKNLSKRLFSETKKNERTSRARNIFSPGMIYDLYSACPKWKKMELEMYGSLLTQD